MNELLAQRIERAKELLKTVRHGAVATVNEDGTPHNSPVYFQYDEALEHLYWSSSPESQHSKNITRTGNAFAVIYEANVGGGLYISIGDTRVAEEAELEAGLEVLNKFRSSRGKQPLDKEYFLGSSPQRMYVASTNKFWVNLSERDENGNIIRDYREEVVREDLL